MNRNRRKKERPVKLACLYYILVGIIAMFVVFVAIAKADEVDGKAEAEQTAKAPIEYRSPDLVYHGDGETAKQLSGAILTREESDVLDAQNGEGRWSMPIEATPDHIDQEKIDDEISENFDLMCDVVFAESGNQGDYGMRLVADVIINRMKLGDTTLHDVLTAKNQFSCIADGGAAKWQGHTKNNVRKLVQRELKQVTDPNIYYFRTGRYTEYGRNAYKYRDVYFSYRK